MTPATPRDAASVVLLRDGDAGLEVYLMQRVATMAFAAGVVVFPGGSVDPRDSDVPCDGADPDTWAPLLRADATLSRALVAAAVRETFEETGVLLAGPSLDEVAGDTTGQGWEADRLALVDGSLPMRGLLERRGLLLRADLLAPWAHWITPEDAPRRFDTRFFVAALPTGQRTRHVGGEADAVLWARPEAVLAQVRAGEIAMLPPTSVTLTDLLDFPDVASVLEVAPTRKIATVLPPATPKATGRGAGGLR